MEISLTLLAKAGIVGMLHSQATLGQLTSLKSLTYVHYYYSVTNAFLTTWKFSCDDILFRKLSWQICYPACCTQLCQPGAGAGAPVEGKGRVQALSIVLPAYLCGDEATLQCCQISDLGSLHREIRGHLTPWHEKSDFRRFC